MRALLNALTGAGVLAEDKLFATLDPITRRVRLPEGTDCLLVDTVGFINKLPHDLVRAFRSTLEEALYADVLVIVEDISDENLLMHREVVDEVLSDLGAGGKPRVVALNKADLVDGITAEHGDHIPISATKGQGLDRLLHAIEDRLSALHVTTEIRVPYARGDVAAFLHKVGRVKSEKYEEEGTLFRVVLSPADRDRAQSMLKA